MDLTSDNSETEMEELRHLTDEEKVQVIVDHLEGHLTLLRNGFYNGYLPPDNICMLIDRYEAETTDFKRMIAEGTVSGTLSPQAFRARFEAVKNETEDLYSNP